MSISVLNFLKANYFLMSLYDPLLVSMFNIMDLLIKFCYQRVAEVSVGESLQAFILVLRKDVILTVARVDIQ